MISAVEPAKRHVRVHGKEMACVKMGAGEPLVIEAIQTTLSGVIAAPPASTRSPKPADPVSRTPPSVARSSPGDLASHPPDPCSNLLAHSGRARPQPPQPPRRHPVRQAGDGRLREPEQQGGFGLGELPPADDVVDSG
jgi:hypothetical protein